MGLDTELSTAGDIAGKKKILKNKNILNPLVPAYTESLSTQESARLRPGYITLINLLIFYVHMTYSRSFHRLVILIKHRGLY